MTNVSANNISYSLNGQLEKLIQTGKSIAIGTFSIDAKLLNANTAMCYFLDADMYNLNPKNQFINPTFSVFVANNRDELVFEGLLTIGNQQDVSYALNAKVFRVNDEILIFAEADVPFLFEENKKMSVLNQEINNLQRALIKEKRNLQNTLAELKETQQMLIQSEKMNAMGKLVAGVAHELNNPISFVYSNLFSMEKYVGEIFESYREVQNLIRKKANDDLIAAVEEITRKNYLPDLLEDIADITSASKGGIERIKTIVEDLRKFSRLDEAEIKQIDLIENINSTINIIRSEIKNKNIDFQQVVPETLSIECYPGQLNQAILNVLINAVDAVEVGGHILLSVDQEEKMIHIFVEDNGCGIKEELKSRIFEPFYTTKPVGSGVGLGLSITYKIIHDLHKGSIEVESELGKGTKIRLTIPTKI